MLEYVEVLDSIASAGIRLKSGKAVRADFVVDASGRGSQLPQWLEGVGVTPPPALTISAGLGYGSRTYAMPDNWFQQKVPHLLPLCKLQYVLLGCHRLPSAGYYRL